MLTEANLLQGLEPLKIGLAIMTNYLINEDSFSPSDRPTWAVVACKSCEPSAELDTFLHHFIKSFGLKLTYIELKAILSVFTPTATTQINDIVSVLMQRKDLSTIKLVKTLVKSN